MPCFTKRSTAFVSVSQAVQLASQGRRCMGIASMWCEIVSRLSYTDTPLELVSYSYKADHHQCLTIITCYDSDVASRSSAPKRRGCCGYVGAASLVIIVARCIRGFTSTLCGPCGRRLRLP